MKIRSERDKRTYLIIALCAILVVMGVGYAAFSSLLTINGTANISNSWCLGFDNTMTNTMQVTKGLSTGTTPTGSMSYSGTACGSNLQPNSSLNAHFYQPGDEIEYTLTITNKSTVTAAIKSILVDNESVTSNTTKKKGNITYVVEMPDDTTLDVNESTTMKVIAKFQNETDVTGNVNGEVQTIEVKINAQQDDGNGGMNITPAETGFTGVLYSQSSDTISVGDTMALSSETKWCLVGTLQGQSYNSCDQNSYINSQSECEAVISNAISGGNIQEGDVSCQQKSISEITPNGVYLKHNIVNGIVQSSEACLKDSKSFCLKPNEYSTSQDTLNSAFGTSKCQLIDDIYQCTKYDDDAVAYQSGKVLTRVGNCTRTSCIVNSDGSAHCETNSASC